MIRLMFVLQGWNRAPRWRVYFCGSFDQPATYKTFLGNDLTSDNLAQYSNATSVSSSSGRLGALFSFNSTRVSSRVGVSFISSAQACRNADEQIPTGVGIANLRNTTRRAWNDQVLSKVTTTDTNVTKLNQLYTALYFMHLLPTNKTGENPLWSSSEPYYDDIFTFWDTV
jgi:putative alpha-1,2-mannosidase